LTEAVHVRFYRDMPLPLPIFSASFFLLFSFVSIIAANGWRAGTVPRLQSMRAEQVLAIAHFVLVLTTQFVPKVLENLSCSQKESVAILWQLLYTG
jgi:hypothetical protein